MSAQVLVNRKFVAKGDAQAERYRFGCQHLFYKTSVIRLPVSVVDAAKNKSVALPSDCPSYFIVWRRDYAVERNRTGKTRNSKRYRVNNL